MATEAIKSTWMTAAEATPPVIANKSVHNGHLRASAGQAAVTNAMDVGSTYRLARIPSNARPSQVLLSCSAITTCAGDVGLYKTARDGGAVVDADFFASAQSLASASVNTEIKGESGLITADKNEKMIWELLGLLSDPGIDYDVVITLTAAAGSAGKVALDVHFCV